MIPMINEETGRENKPEDLCVLCYNAGKKSDGVLFCKCNLPTPQVLELENLDGVIAETVYYCEGFPK